MSRLVSYVAAGYHPPVFTRPIASGMQDLGRRPPGGPHDALDEGTPSTFGMRASELLTGFIHSFPSRKVRLGDLVAAMGQRAFGLLLLIFALPNLLPIPGISSIFGLPLILFGGQMLMGYPRPWLPQRLAKAEIERGLLMQVVDKAAPYMRRVEVRLRPRAQVLTSGLGERIVGAMTFLLGVILIFPIPGGNFPPAISIAMMAMGMIERDGVLVAVGLAVGAVANLIVAAVLLYGPDLLMWGYQQIAPWLDRVLSVFG